jgi:hypothetical protein
MSTRSAADVLAYVFWHWPEPGIAAADYEGALLTFHRALGEARLPGFRGSAVCRVEGADWLPAPAAYEDWYLVDDFAALGALNAGAVAGGCQRPHDAAARLAAGGTAGLYRLAAGAAGGGGTPAQPVATWLAKPAGMRYPELLSALARWTADGHHTLWQRQMTLGPTSEFCLLGPRPVGLALPGLAPPREVHRRTIWPPESL